MANMTSGISSKLRDIILKSKLVQEGPPARYQLLPKKDCLDGKLQGELVSKLRRRTIGEKDPSKINKTVLIVGETGTGKSTLINTMVNYVLGVEWDDDVWFDIIEDEKTSQSESQTSAVTVYEIFGFEGGRVPYSLTIIDTPGFGDTRGIIEDKIVEEELYQLFRSENGVREIDAVAFVMKESTNRLSDRQKYIVAAVVSLFGKDMENNIVALLTYSSGLEPTDALQALNDAKIPMAKDHSNKAVFFQFNNCRNACTNVQKATMKEQRVLKGHWDISMDGLEEFSEFLNNIEPQSVKMTEGVLRHHKQLESCVNNLVERVNLMDVKQKELEKTQIALKAHQADLKTFKMSSEIYVKEKLQIMTPWHGLTRQATTCNICKENCHYPGCWWVKDISWCSAMTGYNCTVCSNKCHYTNHVKADYIWVIKQKTVALTGEDLAQKYGIADKEALIQEQENKLEVDKKKKAKLLMECYEIILELETTGLAISLSTAEHLDFLIESMRNIGSEDYVKKLEEMEKKFEEERGGALRFFSFSRSMKRM